MAAKVYIGDVGTIIDVDCGETISTATGYKFYVKKPDGSEAEWTATIQGTTALKHTAISGDFNVAGTYYIQPYMTLGSWTGRGNTVELIVYRTYA
jgi:hypothetical protein